MAIETLYVVTHGGKPHEFRSQKEAELFETRAGRCDRLIEILTADPERHGLSPEQVESVAWYLAERERELASVFAEKARKSQKNAPRAPRKPKLSAEVSEGELVPS